LQVITDLNSLPSSVQIYPAGPAEARKFEDMLVGANTPKILIADAAYDTLRLRELSKDAGSFLITSNNYGLRKRSLDPPLVRDLARKLRWRVERLFAWLGAYRRVLTRWEKTLRAYSAVVFVALADIIVKSQRKEF
jgi:transposase